MGKSRKRYVLVKKCFEDGNLIENVFKYKTKSFWTDDISKAHVYLDNNAKTMVKDLNKPSWRCKGNIIQEEDRVYLLPVKIVVDNDLLYKDGLLTYPLSIEKE